MEEGLEHVSVQRGLWWEGCDAKSADGSAPTSLIFFGRHWTGPIILGKKWCNSALV